MGRPPTRPIQFKDGFYLEIRNKGSKTGGIKLRRDTEAQMKRTAKEYERMKEVTILGESKNGKWVSDPVKLNKD